MIVRAKSLQAVTYQALPNSSAKLSCNTFTDLICFFVKLWWYRLSVSILYRYTAKPVSSVKNMLMEVVMSLSMSMYHMIASSSSNGCLTYNKKAYTHTIQHIINMSMNTWLNKHKHIHVCAQILYQQTHNLNIICKYMTEVGILSHQALRRTTQRKQTLQMRALGDGCHSTRRRKIHFSERESPHICTCQVNHITSHHVVSCSCQIERNKGVITL